ncbi:hypothetical protein [Rickettsia endosymbiont of Culicoides newsteadi]|uniref:hypothetical protein n=1 Tax=Rickettsia endosymbiont of Culicoides newsteadi TaxID=1961830 RepID=UPI000B9B848A|nr:hypothetical protein [Rickettsia endosymbiont of Culicoides newsteadi]OZG31239.1 ATP-dependent protease [Rickettsia endosymbiont of Culicoides newsteadi]
MLAAIPASLSTTVVKFIRNTIGFKGTLVSDDICMGALHGEIVNKYPEYLEANLILEKYPKTVTTDMLSNEDLQKLTDYGIVKDRYDNIGLKNFLARFPELKAEFIKSLAKIAKQIITIDNNYIALHCSGDIDEMKGICGIDITTLPAN